MMLVIAAWNVRDTRDAPLSTAEAKHLRLLIDEWAHARFGVTPNYRVDERSGPDHDPRFTVTVEIRGVNPETGVDRSKRAAEQAAATKILEREGVWPKGSAAD